MFSTPFAKEILSKNKDNWNQFLQSFKSRTLPQFPDLGYQFQIPVGKPSITFHVAPNIHDINLNGFPVYARNDPNDIGNFFPLTPPCVPATR